MNDACVITHLWLVVRPLNPFPHLTEVGPDSGPKGPSGVSGISCRVRVRPGLWSLDHFSAHPGCSQVSSLGAGL